MTAAPDPGAADLAERLVQRIRRDGPLALSDYMAAALTDPDAGYYTRRDPFGSDGDFITAPEISQMFGEMIGAWCIECWHRMGRPDPFVLAEFGPGRGTLMSDLLRVGKLDPGFRAAAQVHLIETSPALRSRQRAALGDTAVAWHDTAASLPPLPLLALANEFVDALPIRQFERTAAGWCERRIGLAPDTPRSPGTATFCFTLGPPCDPGILPAPDDAPVGAVAETCPQGRAFATTLGARIAANGGAALIVDYGYDQGYGDTLQALHRHRYADPLVAPGTADLTAHVDFAALAAAARTAGAKTVGPVTQGDFLRTLGIEARAAALAATATPAQRRDVASALRRLIASDEMGTLFRVLAVTAPGLPAPVGFSALAN